MSIAKDIEDAISAGRRDACLIDWANLPQLFPGEEDPQSPTESIAMAKFHLEADGWRWTGSQLEKDGWYVWFRSQGRESRPIAQWSQIKAVA